MQYRRLGYSGLKLSEFSFGSWVTFSTQIDGNSAENMMAMAYDHGVNFFDNAEIYASGQSEVLMGQALKNLAWSRDTYIVSSKVFWGGDQPTQIGLSRKHVTEACHAAMKRLQVDYLDLYFCHRPDPETPIVETVWTMNDLIRQGKILYWGTSEWSAAELLEAYQIAKQEHLIGPTMEQPQYNMFHRERLEQEYKPLFEKYGMGTTIWSPLASGLLSGKYSKGMPPDSRVHLPGYEWLKKRFESEEGKSQIAKAEALASLANEAGLSLAQMSLLWCLHNDRVSTVILGASKTEQLKHNLEALTLRTKYSEALHQAIEQRLTK